MMTTAFVFGLMILRLALPLGLLMMAGTYLSRQRSAPGRGDFHGRDA
jgi:hypothetical protein